jgi:hypothetical protein
VVYSGVSDIVFWTQLEMQLDAQLHPKLRPKLRQKSKMHIKLWCSPRFDMQLPAQLHFPTSAIRFVSTVALAGAKLGPNNHI